MALNAQIETITRLLAAVVCGTVLGLNRELHAKPAGVRTQGLVALGAALVTITAYDLVTPVDAGGVTRAIQGVVAGVGFLGAGVIVHGAKVKDVHGLTTAALTWVSACLGIACGAGQWTAAGGALAFAFLLLVVGGPIERMLSNASPRAETPGKSPERPPAA